MCDVNTVCQQLDASWMRPASCHVLSLRVCSINLSTRVSYIFIVCLISVAQVVCGPYSHYSPKPDFCPIPIVSGLIKFGFHEARTANNRMLESMFTHASSVRANYVTAWQTTSSRRHRGEACSNMAIGLVFSVAEIHRSFTVSPSVLIFEAQPTSPAHLAAPTSLP